PCRLVGSEPLCLHIRRHRLSVGTCARRCQRGSVTYVEGDRLDRSRAGYMKRVKDESDPFRLMGFGYRIYKSYDPRSKIMQAALQEVLETLGRDHRDDPILKVALELERIAVSDEYFIENNLSPNLEFYSAITLRALGFPTEMFTVLYAIART